MPAWAAIASAVRRLSPVIMKTSTPILVRRATASLRVVLERVGHGDEAGGRAVDGGEHDGLALALELLDARRVRRDVDALARHEPAVAERHPATLDDALDAVTGDGREADDVGEHDAGLLGVVDDRLGERVLGGLLSSAAASRKNSARSKPANGSTSVTTGLPCVSVPVLSNTIALIL